MLIGYVRVSDSSQSTDLQRDALMKAGVCPERIYEDTASGARAARPGLDECLRSLRQGDTLVAWRLDRLGRSLRQLVGMVDELHQRGINLRILTGPAAVDTSDPSAKLMFHIFAALAEFERELIRERTMAGLAAARDRGRQGGRPRTSMAILVQAAELMKAPDASVRGVARTLGVSAATLYRHVLPNGELRPETRRRLERESVSRCAASELRRFCCRIRLHVSWFFVPRFLYRRKWIPVAETRRGQEGSVAAARQQLHRALSMVQRQHACACDGNSQPGNVRPRPSPAAPAGQRRWMRYQKRSRVNEVHYAL